MFTRTDPPGNGLNLQLDYVVTMSEELIYKIDSVILPPSLKRGQTLLHCLDMSEDNVEVLHEKDALSIAYTRKLSHPTHKPSTTLKNMTHIGHCWSYNLL